MNIISEPTFADYVLFVVALPFALWAAWGDLKAMRISNQLNILLFCAFLVTGILVLPVHEFGIRVGIAVIALVIGFILNSAGAMGGGDAKYIAAFIPFIAPPDIPYFLFLLALCLLAAVVVHRVAGMVAPIRAVAPDWKSWSVGKKFPMGFALSGALILYLAVRAFNLPIGTI